MAWNITERFPSWGETGEFPTAGFFYEGGDQVNEKHLDALWNGVNGLEEDLQVALNDIDSDADGVVDEADTVTASGNLKGDLLTVDSEVLWDESASYIPQPRLQNDDLTVTAGDGLKGGGPVALGGSTTVNVEPADFAGTNLQDDGSDNLEVVQGPNSGLDADTLDGNEASYFTTLTEVNNNADVPNADHADNSDKYDSTAPSDGTSGQFLKTDGTTTLWDDPTLEFNSPNTESGTYATPDNTASTETISLNNTYDPNTFIATAAEDAFGSEYQAGVISHNTNANGNIDSFTFMFRNATNTADMDVHWFVLGNTV